MMSDAKKSLKTGSKYGKKEVLLLKSVFESHDKDGSGDVDRKELVSSVSAYGLDPLPFQTLDKDHDGKITFGEYLETYYPHATRQELKVMKQWAYPAQEIVDSEVHLTQAQLEELRHMFTAYDTNKNGVLERQELSKALGDCGYDPDELDELFNETDVDGSNAISFEEFVNLLKGSYL